MEKPREEQTIRELLIELLTEKLAHAITEERYEDAARYRDQLKNLTQED